MSLQMELWQLQKPVRVTSILFVSHKDLVTLTEFHSFFVWLSQSQVLYFYKSCGYSRKYISDLTIFQSLQPNWKTVKHSLQFEVYAMTKSNVARAQKKNMNYLEQLS